MNFKFSTKIRRLIVVAFDLVAIGVSFVTAFLLRFDFNIPSEYAEVLRHGILWIYLIQGGVFVSQGLYRGLWSFASVRDLYLIVRAVFLGVVLSVVFLAARDHLLGWPRSVFFLDAGLLVLILGGARFSYRMGRELWRSFQTNQRRILIIGAGQSANTIAREFAARPELDARPVGFLDDNPQLWRTRIHGAAVLGPLISVAKTIAQYHPQEVIIAIPSLAGNRVKQIANICRDEGIPCRICPPIRDVLLGKVQLSQLREVSVEDLLRRDVIKVDDSGISESIRDKTILVTGAGGSIGSELCRQVLKYHPRLLVLFERSEYNLYRFERELSALQMPQGTKLRFVIGDILDERRLDSVLSELKPEVVLHAAAYKHVPLMEENVYEAFQNNVIGTYTLARAARNHGVRTFVMISTDKAVRPTNVMGATKRIAELVSQAVAKGSSSASKMRSCAVRFGNVLDSEGSVLPLFREQIAKGGPVTVTHPEITRFFMTIPEASQLVLQASLLGKGGEVFLLDMGQPVLIRELAEDLIRLSGLKPHEEIEIVYTGLRRGEKLYEELLFDMNHAKQTPHPKIMVSTEEHAGAALPRDWESMLQEFAGRKTLPKTSELVQWIKDWVPDFTLKSEAQQNAGNEAESEEQEEEEKDPQYLH